MQKRTKNVAAAFALASTMTMVGGCAVINSHEQTNGAAFTGQEEVRDRLSKVEVGMDKEKVFEILGVEPAGLTSLDRKGIKVALYGSENQDIDGTEEQVRSFLSDMEGYKFHYRDVDKKRSLSLSFRVNTKSSGVDMSISMVFKDGKLFDKPNVHGGPVNKKESDPIIRLDKAVGRGVGF